MAEVVQASPSTPKPGSSPSAQVAPNTPNTALTTTITTTTSSRPPEALATTKRKFHSLLESITRGTSSISAPSTSSFSGTTFDSPAKRIRIEARKRLEASTPSTISRTSAYIQSQLLSSRLAAARRKVSAGSTAPTTGSGSDAAQTEPNYLPWSHEAFLRRLKTFADLSLWTSKPDVVNEVAWAKRGWVCAGVNTVACRGGCEKRVVVALRRPRKNEAGKEIPGSEDYSVDIDEELVRRYVDLIASGHEEWCSWRENGCRDDIYRLQIARPTIWQPQLRERYHSFTAIISALPELSTLQLPFDVAEVVKQFPVDFFQSRDPTATEPPNNDEPPHPTAVDVTDRAHASKSVNLTALAFALLGWQGSSDMQYAMPPNSSSGTPSTSTSRPVPVPTSAIATCKTCFRRLGLWLYCAPPGEVTHTAPIEPATMTLDAAEDPVSAATQTMPPPQRPAPPPPASIPTLDLVNNHRTYCPWISSTSQHMPGSFSGLSIHEILLRLISNTFPSSYISSNTNRGGAPGHGETDGLQSSDADGTAAVDGTNMQARRFSNSTTPYLSQDFQASTTTLHERPLSMMASTIRTVSSTDGLSINSTVASYGDGDDENRLQEHGIGIPSEGGPGGSKKRKKERGEVEREDKARFARLKELGRAIGLGSIKRKKAA